MPKLNVNLFEGRPILDLRSYARRGPGHRDRFSPEEIAQISRTVRRVPEVMVKVLPRDSNKLASVRRHIGYIGRHGDFELETDDGERLSGKGIGRQLVEDWDLDLDDCRRQTDLAAALGRKPPKLVHKLMLSMPPGTPAEGVLAAARNFLREEFAMKHRYAFVLHTDEPHPHVHAIVKAVGEQGVRLNIRKETLREWRREFARHLRALGVEANATERAVRGQTRTSLLDGIYRATRRGSSAFMQARMEAVAHDLARGSTHIELGKAKLLQTRREIDDGWRAVGDLLLQEGQPWLADEVRRFHTEMPLPQTEKERLESELIRFAHARVAERSGTPLR